MHTEDTASQHKPLGGGRCAVIVISFQVLRSKLSRSYFVQFTIPAEYLITATAYILIVPILLQAYRRDLSIWWQQAMYSLIIFFFISFCLMLSASKTQRYLYAQSSSSDLMVSPNGKSIPEDSTLRPRLIDKVALFQIPKSILMSEEKTLTEWVRLSISDLFFPVSSRLSI